jgi:hypothetical protein
VVNFCIGKQKEVWILKLRKNGWEAAASALSLAFSLVFRPEPSHNNIYIYIYSVYSKKDIIVILYCFNYLLEKRTKFLN